MSGLALRVEAEHNDVRHLDSLARTTLERLTTRRAPPAIGARRVDELAAMPRDRPNLRGEIALARRDRGAIAVHQGLDETALAGPCPSEQCHVDSAEHPALTLEEIGCLRAHGL